MKTVQKDVNGRHLEIIYDDNDIDQNVIGTLKIDSIELSKRLQQIGNLRVSDQEVIFSTELKQLSNLIFETSHTLELDDKHLLAFHLVDYYFNHFTGIWRKFFVRGQYVLAANLWIKLCQIIWEWEAKRSIKIHKGSPYYFLGRTLIISGDLDSGFLFVFNAIEEDKRTSKKISLPDRYKQVPAYMFATLVNDPRNLMYDFVQKMVQEIQRLLRQYNNVGGSLKYEDFERKFLHNERLEEISFFFVYNLLQLLKQRTLTRPEIIQNEFTKLKNLDTIFNLCLIVDKVLEEKFHGDSIGANVFNFYHSRGWVTEKHAGELKKVLKSDVDLDKDPDNVVKPLLDSSAKYKGSSMNELMSAMILVWYLRNYGGHNIRGQNVLVKSYQGIIERIFFALLAAVEEL